MNETRLPVTIVGGYLGAGKTTLLSHLLQHAHAPMAVIVNDFGDLDLDASLLRSSTTDVISFANGCICCDLSDGLITALDRIRSLSPAPERLLIEASGVSEIHSIANYANLPGLRLDASICVIDASTIEQRVNDRWVGDLVLAQLQGADLVVLNKVDLVTNDERISAINRLKLVAPKSVVLEALHGTIDSKLLFDQMASPIDLRGQHTQGGTESITTFHSWVVPFPDPIAFPDLKRALDNLPDFIVRAKGVVHIEDEDGERPLLVQVVGRRVDLSDVALDQTTLGAIAFIATRANYDRESIPTLFSS